MLTSFTVRNFKSFDEATIDLGNPVVFIGPNNSGKTSALQALALWDLGLRKWREKRGEGVVPKKRPGIVINRKDFVSAHVPNAKLLWRDRSVQDSAKPKSKSVLIEILVKGMTDDTEWECGFEYHYANEEGFYCRPLRKLGSEGNERYAIPTEVHNLKVSFLPPMSGLTAQEFIKSPGEISFLVGQGRTAEVLRNLCHQVLTSKDGVVAWTNIKTRMQELFGITLSDPELSGDHAELSMTYIQGGNRECQLDLSSAGRGVQQILLLLSYMAVNPGAVILLDEPDAHLEILRQREIYRILSEVAEKQGSQIIMASHSEIILNEAAEKDVLVAFVGKPHRVNDRGTQVLKSLKEIGFDQYYQAEQTGFVLYLEGSTDLAILQSFARTLSHPAYECLLRPFTHYVYNQPATARKHFYGLREAKSDLVGFILCDQGRVQLETNPALGEYMWKRREIENYLCQPRTLEDFAESLAIEDGFGPLFERTEVGPIKELMKECVRLQVPPIALTDPQNAWWDNVKATDDFLDPVFEMFFAKSGHQNIVRKTNYHRLAPFVAEQELSPEITVVLDSIHALSQRAIPTAR